MNMLNIALLIAINAHKGQLDKSGADYISHPVFVALNMDTDEEKITALLHDVLEDSDYTKEQLIAEGIPKNIVEAVSVLTRVNGENYMDYIKRVSENPLAKKVKIADLKHNMDISRISKPNSKDIKRMNNYKKAFEFLTK